MALHKSIFLFSLRCCLAVRTLEGAPVAPSSADNLYRTPSLATPTSLNGQGRPTPILLCQPHSEVQQPHTRRVLPLSEAALVPLPDCPRAIADALH